MMQSQSSIPASFDFAAFAHDLATTATDVGSEQAAYDSLLSETFPRLEAAYKQNPETAERLARRAAGENPDFAFEIMAFVEALVPADAERDSVAA